MAFETLSMVGSVTAIGAKNTLYFTCPVCKFPMPPKEGSIRMHLVNHAKKGEFKANIANAIAMNLSNKKGCNKYLDSMSLEDSRYATYVIEYIKETSRFKLPIINGFSTNTIIPKRQKLIL
jgi:competence CoiA-like predicted nuclease